MKDFLRNYIVLWYILGFIAVIAVELSFKLHGYLFFTYSLILIAAYLISPRRMTFGKYCKRDLKIAGVLALCAAISGGRIYTYRYENSPAGKAAIAAEKKAAEERKKEEAAKAAKEKAEAEAKEKAKLLIRKALTEIGLNDKDREIKTVDVNNYTVDIKPGGFRTITLHVGLKNGAVDSITGKNEEKAGEKILMQNGQKVKDFWEFAFPRIDITTLTVALKLNPAKAREIEDGHICITDAYITRIDSSGRKITLGPAPRGTGSVVVTLDNDIRQQAKNLMRGQMVSIYCEVKKVTNWEYDVEATAIFPYK